MIPEGTHRGLRGLAALQTITLDGSEVDNPRFGPQPAGGGDRNGHVYQPVFKFKMGPGRENHALGRETDPGV